MNESDLIEHVKLALNPKVKNWVLFSKWNRSGNRFWLNCPQGSISYYDRSNLIRLFPVLMSSAESILGLNSKSKFRPLASHGMP